MLWINSFFQSPQWLWLFAALAIPIAIHLLRRSNPQPISFAALQWVQRYSQSRACRPDVDNKWLLLLRLLIVALLALLLGQPLIKRDIYPHEAVILVDPRIEAEEATEFIHSSLPQLAAADLKVLWLSPETTSATSPAPQKVDLWKTLSLLSRRAELRRAHILLINNVFPASHDALHISPHWQWHSLKKPSEVMNSLVPRIAVVGKMPSWWKPLWEDWRGAVPELSFQTLQQGEVPNAQQIDWLIYASPSPLPQRVIDFVADGGLLITDQSIEPPDHLNFVTVDKSLSVQAAPIGRGSWLRYKNDWHSAKFYQRADLSNYLWQQWSSQDWPLLHRNRGQWSGNSAMGISIADTDIESTRSKPLQSWLITTLLILLMLERLIALSRSPGNRTGEVRHG